MRMRKAMLYIAMYEKELNSPRLLTVGASVLFVSLFWLIMYGASAVCNVFDMTWSP